MNRQPLQLTDIANSASEGVNSRMATTTTTRKVAPTRTSKHIPSPPRSPNRTFKQSSKNRMDQRLIRENKGLRTPPRSPRIDQMRKARSEAGVLTPKRQEFEEAMALVHSSNSMPNLPKRTTSLPPKSSVLNESLNVDVDPKTISVAKILATLLSIPSNRSCCDCRSQLVDPSQTFASFSPSLGGLPLGSHRRHGILSFKYHHHAFSPTANINESLIGLDTPIDPASKVTKLLGGHGVFVCQCCAEAHMILGTSITLVKSVRDSSEWIPAHVQYLQQAGGNAQCWRVYEGFMPEWWKPPTRKSDLQERLVFCRAKYDALVFVTPLGGPLSEHAWNSILESSKAERQFDACRLLDSFSGMRLTKPENPMPTGSTNADDGLPDRFADYFCVVGHMDKVFSSKTLQSMQEPEDLCLKPGLIDCYPKPGTHLDMDFPKHVSQFVFPDGCRISQHQRPPTYFTFVLTSSNGHRLFGTGLHIYDQSIETSQLRDVVRAAEFSGPMPWWLTEDQSDARRGSMSDLFFVPRCLVVLSHYGFFDTYRQFLKQLYRISLVEAPLPLERYIANFVSELPLPPQGRVEVKFGFTSETNLAISRPPPNELPLANFSYRPLFSTLSISNIMVIIGCLLQEDKVALLSETYGLLTPVSESLLSLLFPFEWQGIYVPVVPSSMIDLLDAPVPFLLGLHSRYLQQVKPHRRPKGVVLVDLDKDIVHLGYDARTGAKKRTPALPDRDAAKLKQKLEMFGSALYLPPANGIKGMITFGDCHLMQNSIRELYAYMEKVVSDLDQESRSETLLNAEKAFKDNQMLNPIQGFFSEEGQLCEQKLDESTRKEKEKPRSGKLLKKLLKLKKEKSEILSVEDPGVVVQFHDIKEVSEGFSRQEIRAAFLRFFTAIFNQYEKFVLRHNEGEIFDNEAFLDDLNYPPSKRAYMAGVLETQMFQRFLEDKLDDPHDSQVLLFDESITAKNNRSVKKTIKDGGKRETPFLDDQSWIIKDSFTPAAPSNWGLPDDGRGYSYSHFPKLQDSLFGKVRQPKEWPDEWKIQIHHHPGTGAARKRLTEIFTQSLLKNQQQEVPTVLTRQISLVKGPRNVHWALLTMAKDEADQKKYQNANDGSTENNVRGLDLSQNSRKDKSNNLKPHDQSQNSRSVIRRLIKRDHSDDGSGGGSTDDETFYGGDFKPENVVAAEDLLLACRRKQCILVSRIIKIQALARRFLSRESFISFRQAVHLVRRARQRSTQGNAVSKLMLIQRKARQFLQTLRMKKENSAALKIQNIARGVIVRRKYEKLLSSLFIQRWFRGSMVRRTVQKMKLIARKTQSLVRMRNARFVYMLVRHEVSKIQALIRGFFTRRKVKGILDQQRYRYLKQIFTLWKRARTPLSYRAQMWPLFISTIFLGRKIIVSEMERLWELLEIPFPEHKSILVDDALLVKASAIGMETDFESKFLRVSEMIFSAQTQSDKETGWFPGENNNKAWKRKERLHSERLQVYERLNSMEKKLLLIEIYEFFGINIKEKKKKARVLEWLWENPDYAVASSKAIVALFPELGEGVDIKQVVPSKKGLTRFGSKTMNLLDPLDKSMWVDRKIDRLLRQNMASIALASLQGLPELSIKLYTAEVHRTTSFERVKLAHMQSRGLDDWQECKRNLIQAYLQ